MAPDQRRQSDLRWLFGEMALAGISLMLGLLLWLIASNRTDVTISLQIPVRPLNVPPNVEVEYTPSTVRLDLSVPSNLRDLVNAEDFEMPLNLSALAQRAGIDRVEEIDEAVVPGDAQIVGDVRYSPRRINRLSVFPRTVNVRARLITSSFPLEAQIEGEPAEGSHLVGEPTVRPQRIWLTGTQDAVDRAGREVRVLQTEAVNVSGLSSGEHVFSPRVIIPPGLAVAGHRDTEGGVIQQSQGLSLPETQVRVIIGEDIVEREIADCLPRLTFQRANLVLTDWDPRSFTVTVEGPLSTVSRLSSTDFIVVAPLLMQVVDREMSVSLQTEARWREGEPENIRRAVQIRAVNPPQVQVTVERVAQMPPTPVPPPAEPPPTVPEVNVPPLVSSPASP